MQTRYRPLSLHLDSLFYLIKMTRIFYVDDDADDREIFLSAAGNIESGKERIDIKLYSCGDDLLKAIKTADLSKAIIFLDINMPNKTGFQVLTEIRKEERYKLVPIIMYSTSSEEGAIHISYELGANLYAVKPDTINNVQKMIEHVIRIDWTKLKVDMANFLLRY